MSQPLAARLRPKTLATFIGQTPLLKKGAPLALCIEQGKPHSMLFWGPPGTGKTTLAGLIAAYCQLEFVSLSAVLAGVKDIRDAMSHAKHIKQSTGKGTILFIDEIHRFNKAQQDALLPFVEDGTVYFVGATTENPSFEINKALLSRCRVYTLKALTEKELKQVLMNALADKEHGLGNLDINLSESHIDFMVNSSDGDARRLLNILEVVADNIAALKGKPISQKRLEDIIQKGYRSFDKQGDIFYEQISALHKAVRGCSPDGALYWLCRMLDGGCSPTYIARRMVRMATEDIGNADPKALGLALDAWDAYERLGSPEGELALAQVVIYLACAPKSNRCYLAYNHAKEEIHSSPSFAVPIHLRNAPTQFMKDIGYGKDYRYDPNEPEGFARGQAYFPAEMGEKQYYFPTESGLEIKIAEKLRTLKKISKTPT
ncbi:MAG: replication-associated recombination protein A [Proteobacteria bacterium]|nr:replication-associated recombination protein A [Pseudomonadota bacterium]